MSTRGKIVCGSLLASVTGTVAVLVCMALFLSGDLGTGLVMDAIVWVLLGSVVAAFFVVQMISLLCSLGWVRRLSPGPVVTVSVAAPILSFVVAPLFPPLMPLVCIMVTVLALRTWARRRSATCATEEELHAVDQK